MHNVGRILCYSTMSGVNYCLISKRSIWHKLCGGFFTFWKISTSNLRTLWRHLPAELWNVHCIVKYIQSSNRWWKLRPNRSVIGDAILALTATNTWFWIWCCAVVQREKPQNGCTNTVLHMHNIPKDTLENLLPVWLVHTNLSIPRHFWNTHGNS